MEFFDWSVLGTFAGSVLAVSIITQLTKGIAGIEKLPTQIWSYIISVVILIGAQLFTTGLNGSEIALAFINAAMVSIAANGGYAALERIREGITLNGA